MNDQYEMIRCTWNKITKNEETLDLLGYNSLYNLSVSEMVFIFEAIGASIQKQFAFGTREDGELRAEKKMAKSFQGFSSSSSSSSNRFNIPEAAFRSFSDAREALETIVPLITRNSLVYYALSRSSNPTVKELYLGPQTSERPHRIALALSEPTDGGQSSYFHSWATEAKLTYDHQHWVITGEKCRIPVPATPEADYSHYLVFARTSSFADGERPFISSSTSSSSSSSTSSSDPEVGVVALLVPAEEAELSEEDDTDYFGLSYRRLRLRDVKLPRQQVEVVKTSASGDASAFLNVKGAGQLATGAVVLGLLKQLLRNTYAHLVNEKLGLASSDLMQFRLYQATNRIYRLESMLYMSAAMYDCFEPEGGSAGSLAGPNLELEAASVKVAAAEAGQEVCSSLRAIFGSRHPFASTALDLVYALDALLDSSLHNRVLLGRRSVQYYASDGGGGGGESSSPSLLSRRHRFLPKAPIYSVLNYLKFRKLSAGSDYLTRKMTKYAHHNLHSACEWIESCLNRLEFANSFLIGVYGEQVRRCCLFLGAISFQYNSRFLPPSLSLSLDAAHLQAGGAEPPGHPLDGHLCDDLGALPSESRPLLRPAQRRRGEGAGASDLQGDLHPPPAAL